MQNLGPCGNSVGWALQGCSAFGQHGYSAVDHCRILCGWALLGYSAVGHCGDTVRMGDFDCWDTLRIFCNWELCRWAPGYSAAGHCQEGEENTDF